MTPPTQIKLMRLGLVNSPAATATATADATAALVPVSNACDPTRNEPTPKTNNQRGTADARGGGGGGGGGTGTGIGLENRQQRHLAKPKEALSTYFPPAIAIFLCCASFRSCRCRLSLHFDTITRRCRRRCCCSCRCVVATNAAGRNRANHLWHCAGARHLIKYMTGH